MARITDDEVRILNRKIANIYEELWEETGNELFRISYEKTMRCGEVFKGKDGKGKHYNCHDPFCLRCNRRKKNENRKKTEYVLQNAKKKGMKYIHVILTKSNKEINELNVTEKAEEMKNEVFEFVKEMKKIDKKINVIASEEIEVKNGKFNPHWHLVMQTSKRFPKKEIKRLWSEISGGITVFGKNKIEDEWQEKTMSYYISKEKTDFRKKDDENDLKLKIKTLLAFYKGKKTKNGKWTGRQTLFFKGERFEKAVKEYNNPNTEETENDEMKQQMEQMKKQMEQMAEELKRMKQEQEQQAKARAKQEAEAEQEAEALKQKLEQLKKEKEQEQQAKAEAEARAEQEAEALKQELEELKRSKKETEAKAKAEAEALKQKLEQLKKEKEQEQQAKAKIDLIEAVTTEEEEVQVKEYIGTAKAGERIFMYWTTDKKRCFINHFGYRAKHDEALLFMLEEVKKRGNFEKVSKTYKLKEI